MDGGRGYVPIIGQVWRGIFSAIPVFGNLFSWQRPPQNVQHESLLLTNSFITPTSMGLALLYPKSSKAYEGKCFCKLEPKVDEYIEGLENSQENREITFISEDNKKVTEDWSDCIDARKLKPEDKQKIAEDLCNCIDYRKPQNKNITPLSDRQ
ncbi:hypothetical protein H1P_2640004 [Hyella patelloides LEGE 07179]|uniref:Uncharacterized protein n=1 Tax=Hyella patelloides LEGE 07179 TaxID=945734 RepID=A0A563VSJ0_9CYAN|nr:hypothetical protein H1P_2520004 [Hyella patelloides LEGE 07179]VEP14434.1 hypothetical protein H1P_2640004 [Hyella patelloides LEGE 07179]